MSWIFRSLQSSVPDSSMSLPERNSGGGGSDEGEEEQSPDGVKEDLSVIGETIGRQLRGVANFFAPPPSPTSPSAVDEESTSMPSQTLIGIRNDLAELKGSFKSGLSLFSVGEVSKFTSVFLSSDQSNEVIEEEEEDSSEGEVDGDEEYVPGITEDVVDFVKEISRKPEYWTDFPLVLENDFRMADAQKEHASTIEQLVPSFRALRDKLSSCMEDEKFWMVYFILLLPRLNEYDYEILSTPQIVETRNVLLQKLQTKRNEKVNIAENSSTINTSKEIDKTSVMERENSSPNKEVTEIVSATEGLEIGDEDNMEQWLEESDIDTGTSTDKQKKLEHEDDVSFSDLEDDENDRSTRLSNSRPVSGTWAPSSAGSSDWDQLNENSETKDGKHKARQSTSRDKDSDVESNEWLKVDDFD
ncbi:hypothetical protein K2173_020744 [Erythroxylum novogranatense]|uniref:BSD domain-containing protein n=1 Tax=Erythroxylum novogranatense TaxID=1862640 RepID=A0AAV8TPH1_9ROSI|nr:hypothetical protein K2173_020744 [Erythroxylum novogranatense]